MDQGRADRVDSTAFVAGAARSVAWLCFYGVVTVLSTWPLAAHIRTHLPSTVHMCNYDLRLIIWALSWETHALTSAPGTLLDANSFHPAPRTLLYSEPAYGALPFFLPTMLLSGNPILASNLLYLASIALTAWGVHLLVWRGTQSAAAGFVAASTLLTSRWLLRLWGPAAPNYVVLQYLPAIIALGTCRRLSAGYACLLTTLVVLQSIVSPYVAASAIATLGTLSAWRIVFAEDRASARRLVGAVVAATAVVALVYVPNLLLGRAEPHLANQTVWRAARAAPIDVPSGWFDDPSAPTAIAYPLLGLVGLGLVMRLLRPGRDRPQERALWSHGWLWTGVGLGLVVSGGVIVADRTITWPFVLLGQWLPGFALFRVTQRLGVGALLGLALLAGVAFADVTSWVSRLRAPLGRRLLRGGLAVVLAGASAAPFATPNRLEAEAALVPKLQPWGSFAIAEVHLPEPAVQAALRTFAGPLAVIEYLPPGRRRLRTDAQAMFESIGSWYPLVNGYGGYFPAAYPKRMALVMRLPDRDALAKLRDQTGVSWILVRGSTSDARMAGWRALARDGGGEGLRFVVGAGQDLLFSVDPRGL